MQSFYSKIFNNSVITAMLHIDIPLNKKELMLQRFVNEFDNRYDIFCDNIMFLIENKDTINKENTLYLTVDGCSYIKDSGIEPMPYSFPVLTINKYSPDCSDIAVYVELALSQFTSYCDNLKNSLNIGA